MAFASITYIGSGSQTDFTFPFPYLEPTDISVFVGGNSVPFSFLSSSAIRCTTAPAGGSLVLIRRTTSKASAPVDFTDGSNLLERDLDLMVTWSLYVAQEAQDIYTTLMTISGAPLSDSLVAAAAANAAAAAAAASALSVAEMANFSYDTSYVRGTFGWGQRHNYGIDITQAPYNADNTGVLDCSVAIMAAYTANPGIPLRAPAGSYKITNRCPFFSVAVSGAFGPGVKIFGDGIDVTTFYNEVANNAMFDIDSYTPDNHATTFVATLEAKLHGFSVRDNTNPANSTAIKLRTSYHADLQFLRIVGMSADGIRVECSVGDLDASNMLSIKHCWIETCAGWGLRVGDTGHNETSFTVLEQVFFHTCGTASAAGTPPSGGMKWAGQLLRMESCGFANGCQNVGLYIPGQSGSALQADLNNVVFENCIKRGLYCTGILCFKGRNLQFYNNNTYVGTFQCEFDGSAFGVQQIEIDGAVMRATSGNSAITSFKLSGSNVNYDSCRVKNVRWDNFDYAGQARFTGWQFDHVPQQCELVVPDGNTVLFRPTSRGRKTPYRLRGYMGGVPSNTGEWIAHEVSLTGLAITNAGLPAAVVRYYIYLVDNNGVAALEISPTGTQIDPVSGYEVKAGDVAKLYCGSVVTNISGNFMTTGTGYLNPLKIPGTQTGVWNSVWTDATGAVRIRQAISPTSDTDGTVIGTQT